MRTREAVAVSGSSRFDDSTAHGSRASLLITHDPQDALPDEPADEHETARVVEPLSELGHGVALMVEHATYRRLEDAGKVDRAVAEDQLQTSAGGPDGGHDVGTGFDHRRVVDVVGGDDVEQVAVESPWSPPRRLGHEILGESVTIDALEPREELTDHIVDDRGGRGRVGGIPDWQRAPERGLLRRPGRR